MGDVRILEANNKRSEFRQAQPLRYLTLEHAPFTVGSPSFSGDHQNKSRTARARNAKEAQKRRVRFALGQPVQIQTAVDCFFAASDPRAHAASEWRKEGRRPVFCRLSHAWPFCRRYFNLRSDMFRRTRVD